MMRRWLVLSVTWLFILSRSFSLDAFSGTDPFSDRFNKADWNLSAAEAKQLEELLRKLEDKKRSVQERRQAATKIGEELPHKSAIPTLVRVVQDTRDDRDVRYWALTALSQIADKSVIPMVIEALSDPTPQIRFRADEQLWKLASAKPHSVMVSRPNISSEEVSIAINSWKEWWKKNEKTFKFERFRVLFEY